MASPRPPPNFPTDLEITIISAKHLKNVNWRNGDLKPYAVAYLDPDRRSATKPDDSGNTRPVWNERLSLPLSDLTTDPSPLQSLTLTLDIFHSKPSETPKPLVGTSRVSLKSLLDLDVGASIKTLELRRPSGRPQGKVRIKIAIRERPLPPPSPVTEHSYQMPPPPPSGYYYSTAPPPIPHYSVNPNPSPSASPYFRGGGGYSDPYSGYFSSGAGYYSAPPRPMYYDRPGSYGGPSAPVDYSHSSYEQKAKGSRIGMGAGLAVGAVAGALGGLALEEGVKYEEEKIAERVEGNLGARDDYSEYRGEY